jgi:hypothetical protein
MRSPAVSAAESTQPLPDATFTLASGRLSLSPLTLAISSALEIRPWLSGEFGQLLGSGSRGGIITAPHDESVLWASIGEGIEARWLLGTSLWATLDLQVAQPLVRRKFVFQSPASSTLITQAPFLQGVLGLGLGGRIL